MRLSRVANQQLTLELSEAELLVLKSCLRESFATLDRRDFPLRVGVPIDVAAKIAEELSLQMRFLRIEE